MLNRIIKKLKRLFVIDHSLDNIHQEVIDLRLVVAEKLKSEELMFSLSRLSNTSTKAQLLHNQIKTSESNYKTREIKSIEHYESSLQELDPKIFPIYKMLFENGKKAYEATVEGNLSNWDSPHSQLFEQFVFNYISGRVLDIGCGNRNKPMYLSGYPDENISAVEPLELAYKPPFEVIRGFCEFLPWNDNSFSTAIAATSMDHVLNLDRSLEEIKRVLLPNGLFLVWISSIENAKPYNPKSPDFKHEDEFHLFHFDQKWLEPLMQKHNFEIVDKVKIPQPGFEHIYYCFQSKKV